LWIFKLQFQMLYDDCRDKVQILINGHDSIKNSSSFKQWLSYVLVVGNYMNNGSRKGNAKGFRLNTLLQLGQSKASDGKQTLLAFMLLQCRQLHPNALTFLKEFENTIPSAIRLDLNQLESDTKGLGIKLKEIEEMGKKLKSEGMKNSNDLFVNVMSQFCQSKFPEYQKLENDLKAILQSCKDLGIYLGEKDVDPLEAMKKLNSFRTECQGIISNQEKKEAAERAKKIKEEKEREKKERNKQEREKKTKLKEENDNVKRQPLAHREVPKKPPPKPMEKMNSGRTVLTNNLQEMTINRQKKPEHEKKLDINASLNQAGKTIGVIFKDLRNLVTKDQIQDRRNKRNSVIDPPQPLQNRVRNDKSAINPPEPLQNRVRNNNYADEPKPKPAATKKPENETTFQLPIKAWAQNAVQKNPNQNQQQEKKTKGKIVE